MMDIKTQMRITGLASGLDTDSIIQGLGRVHTLRIDSVKRDRQMALWRQDALRSTINMISDFMRSNLNVANPSSNFRSPSAFAKFSYNLSMGSAATEASKAAAASVLSVTANGDLKNFSQTVEKVTQLATKDTWEGTEAGLRSIKSKGFDFNNLIYENDDGEKNGRYMMFGISIDGVSRTITLDNSQILAIDEDPVNNVGSPDEINLKKAQAFVEAINAQIVQQFGNDYSAGVFKIDGDGELNIHMPASNVTLFEMGPAMKMLEVIGLDSGGMSTGDVGKKTLGELFDLNMFGGSEKADIVINDTIITINKSDTISSLITKINNSEAGVTLSYNTAGDKFTLTSKNEGTASNISDITGNAMELFAAMKLGDAEDVFANDGSGTVIGQKLSEDNRTIGTNLIATINGVEFIRQSNTFQFEGMSYTFHSTFDAEAIDPVTGVKNGPIKINVAKNTSEIVDSIKSFVDEYNKILDNINTLLNEKRDRDYRPLSDDEKKAMSEDEVKAYEERAKLGMLANDSDLRRLQSELRSIVYQQVEGVGLTMSDIGITTTPNWQAGGKLVIDETKLNNALESNYDQVVALFTQSSDIRYEDTANRGQRRAESGIAQRLNDVMNDAVRTTTGSTNSKGYLVEKAGLLNDGSVRDNTIQRQIDQYDKRIQTLLERWYRQENMLYASFARMETALSKMQAQQNNLASILSQGQ